MTAKKRQSKDRSIWKWLTLIPSVSGLVHTVLRKLKMEVCFTLKNTILLLMLALTLACLLVATWIGLLAMLFFGLLALQWSVYAAALLVMSLNIICLLILCIAISVVKNKLIHHHPSKSLSCRE
ncbi:MAG TPA: hypothetical protein VLJ15_03985 [Gammaproteobacteria bacterium]|nr:hypothetical protein [Gammaproteobacteria bacterium]